MMEDNPRIRLIAVDLDGTLLTSEGVVAPEGSQLLKTAAHNGVHVILATGRDIYSVRDLCASLEINNPVICTDGAQVYESISGPILTSVSFPREIGLEIAKLADDNRWELSTTVEAVTYWRQRPGQALGPLLPGRVVVANNSDAVTDDLARILVTDLEAVKNIQVLCETKFSERCRIEIYHDLDGEIDGLGIIPPGVNKGNALDSVLHHLRINQSEVMAIGDDLNDMPMFDHARISVAMSNAHEKLKERATVIAPSNDEEGVAWVLTRFRVSS